MNFGQAFEALNNGQRVTRSGWNGQGQYVYMVPGTEEANAYFVLKNAQGRLQPGWVPSMGDLFGQDWTEAQVEPVAPVEEKPAVIEGPRRGHISVFQADEVEIKRQLIKHGATILNSRSNDMKATVDMLIEHPSIDPAQLGQPTKSYTVTLENGNIVFREVAA